ncbi:excalibur calcium-binding domain-containing protein [Rhodococcus sp. PAM 2766]|uniref:Excalibur calcium-binding domain-containing protein n=1 Tax=Rhodococcus parequi TaxID=3137122 RepID=A0ABW9FEQ5_9NOCA
MPAPLPLKSSRPLPWVRRVCWLLLAGGVAVSSTACGSGEDTASPTTAAPRTSVTSETTTHPSSSTTPAAVPAAMPSSDGSAAATLGALEALPVKGRAPKTGYDRALFGQAWSDDVTVGGGHNGCDTRNDILRRDLIDITVKPGSNNCTVLTGTLDDVYTGRTIEFVRGEGTSNAVQIDHVVALSDAWQKGAQQLDETALRNLANDPRNLQAVDGPTNGQKSDGDAATWLPPNKAYRCTYVSRQVEVKAAYGLWVTQAEKDAIGRVLGDCGAPSLGATSAPAPASTTPTPLAPPATAAVRQQAPEPAPVVAPVAPRGDSVHYANCAAARAAGAAPIYAGQPGYSSKLDRDNDGVACE